MVHYYCYSLTKIIEKLKLLLSKGRNNCKIIVLELENDCRLRIFNVGEEWFLIFTVLDLCNNFVYFYV